jgi:2-polyprenyl-3-methyl-5-hydroxy-6-metoxy-1,4-benzoquinol methylase
VKTVRVSRSILAATVSSLSAAERDETAVPSYCHANPLVRWVFWRRLDAALALADLQPGETILDYGTGSGVLLPSLVRVGGRIVVVDAELAPCRKLCDGLGLGPEFVPLAAAPTWAAANAGGFDCVFALDVLEHVREDDLVPLLGRFRSLLTPGGRLVVSGPTETRVYRAARRLAGFRGDYHHRSIWDIAARLHREWRLDGTARVPGWPLPQGFLVARYTPSMRP